LALPRPTGSHRSLQRLATLLLRRPGRRQASETCCLRFYNGRPRVRVSPAPQPTLYSSAAQPQHWSRPLPVKALSRGVAKQFQPKLVPWSPCRRCLL